MYKLWSRVGLKLIEARGVNALSVRAAVEVGGGLRWRKHRANAEADKSRRGRAGRPISRVWARM